MNDEHNRPVLIDGDITLRAPIEDDCAARLALGRPAEILRMLGHQPKADEPYTQDMAQRWVDRTNEGPNRWCIEHQGALSGWIWLHYVNESDRNTTLAVALLDAQKLGQGIGTRAMRLVLMHAFNTLKLHRIALRVLDFNTRAIAAYTKLGFVEEGRLRQNAWLDGAWHDDIMMGLLAPDWQAAQ